MFGRWTSFKSLTLFPLGLVISYMVAVSPNTSIYAQDDKGRDIISEDFLKNRRSKPKSIKDPKRSERYQPASGPTKPIDRSRLLVGMTIWKLETVPAADTTRTQSVYGEDRDRIEWRRVEAGAQFYEGDSVRLSIESPRAGYLYVIDRDCLFDGTFGETNLIFPTQGEDNRLEAGKLIDIPGQGQIPFKASPKANQLGELLTFIVTSSPLPVRLSSGPLRITRKQIIEWEEMWGAEADRYEMNGGAGQTRTKEEQLAASPIGTRQLTREDPLPQTVYSLLSKNKDAILFSVTLSYAR